MKTLIFIETILLLVMTSCGSDNASTDGFITVDVTKSSYSPKKENDEFINHGYVQAIGKKYIIVRNYNNDGDIFVYDRKGKAICKINRKGQGGEEYISCRSVTLDEENEELFINDFLARKITVYDLKGNFKRSFKQKQEGDTQFYLDIIDYDKDNLICYDECNADIPFLLVSKQDGQRDYNPI